MPWAMVPPPATDQPCAAWVVFLGRRRRSGQRQEGEHAGALRADRADRTHRQPGRRQRGQLHLSHLAGSAGAGSAGAGSAGQQRDRDRAAARGGRAGTGDRSDRHLPGRGRGGGRAGCCAAAGWPSCAAPPIAPSATRTSPAGTRWLARISPDPASGATACRAGRRAAAAAPRRRRRCGRGVRVGVQVGPRRPRAGVCGICCASPAQGAGSYVAAAYPGSSWVPNGSASTAPAAAG